MESGECVMILPGHENCVSVLSLPTGDIVTGSTGVQTGPDSIEGYQIRIWRNGAVMKSIKRHTAAVRDLCIVEGLGFASVGNDGLLVVFTNEGDELMSASTDVDSDFAGFLLTVAATPEGDIITGGEDCVLRVYRSGVLIQSISHPNTIWEVCVMDNGDIVTACEDKVARVFTRDPSRIGSEAVVASFVSACEERSSRNKKEIDVSSLPDYESRGAAADGKVQVFRREGKGYAYRYDASLGDWILLGEVVTQAAKKTSLNGIIYNLCVSCWSVYNDIIKHLYLMQYFS